MEGHDQKKTFSGVVPPLSRRTGAPHFQIRPAPLWTFTTPWRMLFSSMDRARIRVRLRLDLVFGWFVVMARACERSVSRVENGAQRAENRLESSGAVSGVQKIKWSGAGAGGRRNGQNLPLKICSAIKPLKVKSSKSILKVTTKLSV